MSDLAEKLISGDSQNMSVVFSDNKQYTLLCGQEYRIGRVNADIQLDDQSISRSHALLNVSHLEHNLVSSRVNV